MAEKRVNPQVDARDEEHDGVVTTMADVTSAPPLPEVEVDPIMQPQPMPQQPPQQQRGRGMPPQPQEAPPQMVVIRVNQDVEDMSWVAGGRTEHYTFQAGNRYRVPIYIARELEGLGKVWH